ncbi:VanZ like protein [Roseinatronobacter thiooxidans]|uniref:VanZ like protein n=1 Tax=Roseinatronobacter thiooxidans TaxID=121821 RepID=A0A2W7QIK0_9RHOB|nr:VanZ family protein [Roseinatronobacter thiooxidans]PZX47951.1 VanZ like protein [Roseinatronobacter thiooxidans]
MAAKRPSNRTIGYAVSAGLALIITAALLAPMSGVSGPKVTGLDKIIHFFLFFILVLPALMVAPRIWVWVVPVAIVYGGLIEIIQPYFGRGMEFGDFIANTLGVLAAVPVSRWLHARVSKGRQLAKNKRAECNY